MLCIWINSAGINLISASNVSYQGRERCCVITSEHESSVPGVVRDLTRAHGHSYKALKSIQFERPTTYLENI